MDLRTSSHVVVGVAAVPIRSLPSSLPSPVAPHCLRTPPRLPSARHVGSTSGTSGARRRGGAPRRAKTPVTRSLWGGPREGPGRPPAQPTPQRTALRDYDEDDDLYEGNGGLGDRWRGFPPPRAPPPPRGGEGGGGGGRLWGASGPVIASAFLIGIGAGIAVDTVVNVEPSNVASREVIDRQVPNPDVCIANGMSAMVLDQRLFISFNPFNVYVSQAEVKPGCVLRQSNWQVLESRGLVSRDEARDCRRNMNTFGFVGDLRGAPEVSCVYHSETAENQYLKDPAKARLGDGFQPRDFTEE